MYSIHLRIVNLFVRTFQLLLFSSFFLGSNSYAQSIGLVLSGGGANGIAHVGVIKALEENNIPIDFITGTSSGAFVGAMYAAGYTPEQMEAFFLSDKFQRMTRGEIEDKDRFFFKEHNNGAGMVKLRLSKSLSIPLSLPTNLATPSSVDYQLMQVFAAANSAAKGNFDSLLVPFRCVAADIDRKEEYVFKNGDLATAVRASFTYPFYLKPIQVDGRILFDGGLYNNFPHDKMTENFNPDFIIGIKVTSNEDPSNEDDLLSQVKNMLISKTDFQLKSKGIIIEPETNHGTFEFKNIKDIIDSGYAVTIRKIDQIRMSVAAEVTKDQIKYEREKFNSKKPPLIIDRICIEGVSAQQASYLTNNMWQKNHEKAISNIRKNYYRTSADPFVSSLYPTAKFNPQSNLYDLDIIAKNEKPFSIEFGGNVSNRPISTGYVGVKFMKYRKVGWRFRANTYFGRFYNSGLVGFSVDITSALLLELEGDLVLNNWNYFKSKDFFFDDKKPTYLIQSESFAEARLNAPVGNNSKAGLIYSFAELNDDYYQLKEFTSEDIPDNTRMNTNSAGFQYEFNTQNRKIYASSGTLFKLSYRYSAGEEETNPGTTAETGSTFSNVFHDWHNVNLKFDYFYKKQGLVRMGVYSDINYNNQNLFSNYTASILRSPVFQPTPESKTLFLESFRAYEYASIGQKFIITPINNFDIRFGAYFMSPYRRVIKNDDGTQSEKIGFESLFSIATGSLVYNSPVGPVSIGLNYYYNVPEVAPENTTPLTFLFHFGYILFNKKALF